MMERLKDWVKEPSTWRGLALIAGLLGVNIAPELLYEVGTGVMAVVAIAETLKKEK